MTYVKKKIVKRRREPIATVQSAYKEGINSNSIHTKLTKSRANRPSTPKLLKGLSSMQARDSYHIYPYYILLVSHDINTPLCHNIFRTNKIVAASTRKNKRTTFAIST